MDKGVKLSVTILEIVCLLNQCFRTVLLPNEMKKKGTSGSGAWDHAVFHNEQIAFGWVFKRHI